MSYLYQPALSPGLLDGATDMIGGDPLQEPVEMNLTSDASGHILIPAEHGGGVVTWVRGVWDEGTQFRYNDFMAGTTDPDATNYASPDSAATAANRLIDGVYSTLLIPDGTAPDTVYHVRFSRRSGEILQKGSPINGWPYNYVDPVYLGTAVDGDMYVMWACEFAYAATGNPKYRQLSRRIGLANLDAGRWAGNRIDFGIPFYAEAGQTGLYEYYADTTAFLWEVLPRGDGLGNCLTVQTQVHEGGPPYNYAGWGSWPAWNITADEPFRAFSFEFDGGGCGRNIALSTRVIADDPAGDVGVLVPCLSTRAGRFTAFEFTAADFWRLDNVILEYRHKAAYWESPSIYYGPNGTKPSLFGVPVYPTWSNDWSRAADALLLHRAGTGIAITDGQALITGAEYYIDVSITVFADFENDDLIITAGGATFRDYQDEGSGSFVFSSVFTSTQPNALTITPSAAFDGRVDIALKRTFNSYSHFSTTETLDAIALAYDFKFNASAEYGSNLVANGDFSGGLTGWTDASSTGGTVTVTDGIATLTHTTGRARLRQGVAVEIGKTYLIEFTCSGFAAAAPFVDIGTASGSGAYFRDFVCTNGLMTAEVTAGGTTALWLNFFSDDVGSYSLDNVRIREYLSSGQKTSGDIGIDITAVDSTGAAVLHVDLESTVSGSARLSVRDANAVRHTLTLTLQAQVRATHDFTFADYPRLVHPINQLTLEPLDHGTGRYTLLGIWLDDVVTFQDLIDDDTANAFEGFEFQFPSHPATEPGYRVRFASILLDVDLIDGTVEDRQRYAGIPRWTYKWTMADQYAPVGYGSWRGWSAPCYLWLGGWTNLGIVNPDTGREMADRIRAFMLDAQNAYGEQFGHYGPFMPRYGRAAWEALNQEGIVDGAFTSNTYNRWYFPWEETLGTGPGADQSDDWYGYMGRVWLSCASDYFLNPTDSMKTVLDRFVSWCELGDDTFTRATTATRGFWTYDDTGEPVRGIVWDTDYWRPPSAYIADGRVRYHYHPPYAWACLAQALLFKVWTDGDAVAERWVWRLVEYLNSRRIMAEGSIEISIREEDDSGPRDVLAFSGRLAVVQRGEEGEGYTTATVTLEGDGTGAAVVPRLFAGRIRYYEITNPGLGYTWIRGTVNGDGQGATVCLALYDQMVGAFDLFHTGWEIWEIYNLYAMLALGRCPGGTVNYPVAAGPVELAALAGLEAYFARNTRDEYPMMQLANGLPMHEYGGWDPYHHGSGIENPMIRDSRTRGKLWTETTGPAMRAGVFWKLLHE